MFSWSVVHGQTVNRKNREVYIGRKLSSVVSCVRVWQSLVPFEGENENLGTLAKVCPLLKEGWRTPVCPLVTFRLDKRTWNVFSNLLGNKSGLNQALRYRNWHISLCTHSPEDFVASLLRMLGIKENKKQPWNSISLTSWSFANIDCMLLWIRHSPGVWDSE